MSQGKTSPLPRIDDTLDTLAGAKLFSALDMKGVIGKWICIRTTRRRLHYVRAKGYGISQ
jgi:hypothetical protein